MPAHDWTRESAGTFHDFDLAWIGEIRKVLNRGLLPQGYYALAEQAAGDVGPDVLTLKAGDSHGSNGHPAGAPTPTDDDGGVAVAVAPPRVRFTAEVDLAQLYAARRRRLVIRHATDDEVIALLEIVSPGNKDRQRHIDNFVDKAIAALDAGYHLLVIDLFPPGPCDPQGIHGAIWDALAGPGYQAPADSPLTLASYVARPKYRCYVEPTAVGAPLIDMPLFLSTDRYVNVPLEATYQEAWSGVPERWKRVIEGRSDA